MIEPIAGILDQFDVISFDVFDTLLNRTCGRPQAVFELIEQKSGRKGFARARVAAERKANRRARHRGDETSLGEIYSLIPKFADLKEREIAAETDCLRGNPEMLAVWRKAGELDKKRVIVSDMYLSRQFIEERLRENGIDGWDGFFLSSEKKAKKSTGELFCVMLNEMRVPADRVLHIGDNPNGDVKQANKVGIAAYQYCRGCEETVLDGEIVRGFKWATPLLAGLKDFKTNHLEAGYWGTVGFMLGGVLGYAYVKYVGERAKAFGLKRLLLVARDGYHLEQIFNKFYPELKTDYIYAPRRLWHDGEVDAEYIRYVRSLDIMDPKVVGFVDLTTSKFSGLKLFERALGAEVQAFNLLVYKPQIRKLPKRVHAMYHAHGSSIVFNILCEYIFSAPTPAVIGVKNGGPVYDEATSFYDQYKMGLCDKIRAGTMAAVDVLRSCNADIPKCDLLDWMEAFYAKAGPRDLSEFSLAREASGISYANWRPILAGRERRSLFKLLGRIVMSYAFSQEQMKRYVTFFLVGRYPLLKIRLPF